MSTEDLREKILRQEYEKYFAAPKWNGSPTKATNINWMKNALDEYFTERAMELLEFMSKHEVSCEVNFAKDKRFYYKGTWISKEELFKNFL